MKRYTSTLLFGLIGVVILVIGGILFDMNDTNCLQLMGRIAISIMAIGIYFIGILMGNLHEEENK
jgi:membrane-bound ClpP family serine protease